MKLLDIEKWLGENVAVFAKEGKLNLNGSKFLTGKLITVGDNSLTIELTGHPHATEANISTDCVALVTLSKK